MGMKKRNQVSAEFSMSSLTDIIFLLLIFFMLTANFVQIKPFELPKSDARTLSPTSIVVNIEKNGTYTLKGKELSLGALQKALKTEVAAVEDKSDLTIAVAAEVGTPFDQVQKVMSIAKSFNVKMILATQPK